MIKRTRFPLFRSFALRFVLFVAAQLGGWICSAAAETPLFRDSSQPVEVRVHDLIGRLTLDEKAGLMKNAAEPVPRLGIPRYDWWNEALHGVARAGRATVFPQAIGLAAMWDEGFMREVADTISTEARAKYRAAQRDGRAGERYRGLTFWTPNINLFRDPRWGRGQETYGEDPFLTGRLGVAFVRGLQGDDPNHLKTAACAKHFAVHSGPEATRYHVNVEPPRADLYESYLPAFEALVREGHVEAVMTAYNALYGEPCSINPLLYSLLREWNFDGHVVCDCGAVYCVYEKYQIAHDFPEAEALAVKAGLSLRCGDGAPQLGEAVRRGLLTTAELDASLARLLRTQFRLGFFDPPAAVPFTKIPETEYDTPAQAALALEAARKSIVLLRNEAQTLPLNPAKLHRVLVVGPNANSIPALLGNYHGTPDAPVTVLAGLRAALEPQVAVDYVRGCDYAELKSGVSVVPRTALTSVCECDQPDENDDTGLQAEFFANPNLEGAPSVRRRDHELDFTWSGQPPATGVPARGFSARWAGTLLAPIGGEYRFTLKASGRVRLLLNRELVVDTWQSGSGATTAATFSRSFADDANVAVKLEYSDSADSGDARGATDAPAAISLQWTPPPADAGFAAALARAKEADAIVFVGGISAQLEGEDMRVDYDGFSGGDRTRIELPAIQQRLIEALAKTGRPVVLVNLSGSAMAFPRLESQLGAVLQAWYPGQAGGTAVADVLLGKTNPAGRLPVTFYRSTGDLPAFDDYRMANRTYRYFRGPVQFPFGHGLSYTSFTYSNLKAARGAGGAFTLTLDLSNTGAREGDEVVQVYLQEPAVAHPRATESLAGFRRVHLKPGEKATVSLPVSRTSLRRWDDGKGRYRTPTGEWRVLVGASSADIRLRANVLIDH